MPINAAETPIIAVVVFALWTALLALSVPIWRLTLVASGQARAGDFTPGDAHGSQIYWRLNRAHANSAENLAVFGALAVCGLAAGISDPTFGLLCVIVMFARILQSAVHVASSEPLFMGARFIAFFVQIVCYIGIGIMTLERMF